MITQKYLDELTYEIIGSAIEVHKIMGRGLLENVYHQCLIEELKYFFQNGYTNGTHLTSKSLNKKCKNHIYVKPKKNKEETTYILCKYVK